MKSLQERIEEYSATNQHRLMPRLPWLALCKIFAPKKRTDEEKISIAMCAAKSCNSLAFIIFENDSFVLLNKQIQRWESMPGLGYTTRIAGIIASSLTNVQLKLKVHLEPDIWQLPDELEVFKFLTYYYNTKIRIFKRFTKFEIYSPEEINSLPEKHAARNNPLLPVFKINYEEVSVDKIKDQKDFLFRENHE
jgi:hypothetical protein